MISNIDAATSGEGSQVAKEPTVQNALETRASIFAGFRLAEENIKGPFDRALLCDIHRHLTSEIYSWAGEIRKPGQEVTAMGQVMCRSEYVDRELNKVLEGIKRSQPSNSEDALNHIAHWWGEMTMVHPFQDGNSRTQFVFFTNLSREWGAEIKATRIIPEEVHAARYLAAFFQDGRYLAHALSRGVAGCEPVKDKEEREFLRDKGSVELYRYMVSIHRETKNDELYPHATLQMHSPLRPAPFSRVEEYRPTSSRNLDDCSAPVCRKDYGSELP